MKKFFESKKVKLILTGLLLALVTVGSTFAWWTASVQKNQKITMGKLGIDYTIDTSTLNPDGWEPGLEVDLDGKIKNTGSIPVFMSVSSKSTVTKTDGSGEQDAGSAVTMTFGPTDGSTMTDAYWFIDNNQKIYLLLEIGASADVTTLSLLDGPGMDNSYQGAEVNLKATVDATQVQNGAILSKFGISLSDLNSYPTTRALGSTDGMTRLKELLNRSK